MTHSLTDFPRLLEALVSIKKETKGLWEKVINERALPQKRLVPMCLEHTQLSCVLAPTQDLVWLRSVFALCQRKVVPGTLASALGHPAHPGHRPRLGSILPPPPACTLKKSPCWQGGFSVLAGCSPMEEALRALSWTLRWGLPTRTYMVFAIGESACQYQWP